MFVSGWTPLHEACNHGHQEITRYLLQNGANVNSKGLEDDTPLHDAVTNSHSDLVQLLLQYGANPLLKNKRGERPLDIADDEAIKDMMLTVMKNRKNSDSEHEWPSPTQSDTSHILHKNSSKIRIATSPHTIGYYDNKSSSKNHEAFTCDSSGDTSCDEDFRNKGQNCIDNNILVNGYRAGTVTNSTPKRKIKKSKADANSKICSIQSTPSRRRYSVSSSTDSSPSSSSDSSSDSENSDEITCLKNGVQGPKIKKHGKRKSVGNDHIKRKSLFHNDNCLFVPRNSSTPEQLDQSWRKKPTQNLDQRIRSRSHEENKLTSKPNDINTVSQNNIQKLNGTDPSSWNGFNLSNANLNKGGQNVDDSIYDFSPSIEDNMITTSGISLKREYRENKEYKDKSSELFDMLCLGKSGETLDIETDLSQFNYGVEPLSLTTSTPSLKDKSRKPVSQLNGDTTLLTSVEKADEVKKAPKMHTSTSVAISKSNGVRNKHSHIESNSNITLTGEEGDSSVLKVPVANITLDLSREDMKTEKKRKKNHISLSPKKMQDGQDINSLPVTIPVSKKESKADVSTDVKFEKKKKVSLLGDNKILNDKHPTSGPNLHKKKKKRHRKHSQDASLGEHKPRHNVSTADELSADKSNVLENNVSSLFSKPVLKRSDSTKSLQRKLSLDVKADAGSGLAKKKIRSSDSACSEPGLKNCKRTTPGHKPLKHSSSNHTQDKSGTNPGKRDKSESRKFFLVSDDANSSFFSELEKSSRHRYEQEQKLKIQRKRKLQQQKAKVEAALKAKQNASLNKKTTRAPTDVPESTNADRNGGTVHHTHTTDSLLSLQDNNSMGSPLHEHSNSMSSIDSRVLTKRLLPSRSISQIDSRGIVPVELSGCWGQSPDKSSFVTLQDSKMLPVHRSLSFSGQPDATLDSHPLPSFTGQPPVLTALPADGSLLSPTVQPVHNGQNVVPPTAGQESFPSNVPISSPMIAARVSDQCLTATQPIGSMSRATTVAFSDQTKVEFPPKSQCQEICAESTRDFNGTDCPSLTSDDDKQLNSNVVEAKVQAEAESEKLRILAEKEEKERKQALQIYIQDRLSEMGNVIDEPVPKKLPVFIPMEKLNAAGNKIPLRDRMNIYEEWMIIQKQISERRRKYYAAVVIPQAPNCYLEYMTYRGTYLLNGRKESWLSVPLLAPPPSLGEDMRALFAEHERERVKLRLQHATQREKLIVACEQEIMRVHSRAARMLQNQQVPLSTCSVFLDREVYHLERQNKRAGEENTNRVSIRDRFNGRMMLSWLQDVDDKYVKIKKVLLDRQRHESQALHAVQRTEWFLKVQEIENNGQQKKWSESKPEDVSELYVPLVNISDDFPLLPG